MTIKQLARSNTTPSSFGSIRIQLLNRHCRHIIFLPTLTNTPKIKAISEVVSLPYNVTESSAQYLQG